MGRTKKRLMRHASEWGKLTKKRIHRYDTRNIVIGNAETTFDLIIDDANLSDYAISSITTDVCKMELAWREFLKTKSEVDATTPDKLTFCDPFGNQCFRFSQI